MAQRTILIIDETPDHRGYIRRLQRGRSLVIEAAPGNDAQGSGRPARPDPHGAIAIRPAGLGNHPAAARRASPGGHAADPCAPHSTTLPPGLMRRLGCSDFVDKLPDIRRAFAPDRAAAARHPARSAGSLSAVLVIAGC